MVEFMKAVDTLLKKRDFILIQILCMEKQHVLQYVGNVQEKLH